MRGELNSSAQLDRVLDYLTIYSKVIWREDNYVLSYERRLLASLAKGEYRELPLSLAEFVNRVVKVMIKYLGSGDAREAVGHVYISYNTIDNFYHAALKKGDEDLLVSALLASDVVSSIHHVFQAKLKRLPTLGPLSHLLLKLKGSRSPWDGLTNISRPLEYAALEAGYPGGASIVKLDYIKDYVSIVSFNVKGYLNLEMVSMGEFAQRLRILLEELGGKSRAVYISPNPRILRRMSSTIIRTLMGLEEAKASLINTILISSAAALVKPRSRSALVIHGGDEYTAREALEAASSLKSMDFKVDVIAGGRASFSQLVKALKTSEPSVIHISAHGSLGRDGSVELAMPGGGAVSPETVNREDPSFRGALLIALACHSADITAHKDFWWNLYSEMAVRGLRSLIACPGICSSIRLSKIVRRVYSGLSSGLDSISSIMGSGMIHYGNPFSLSILDKLKS